MSAATWLGWVTDCGDVTPAAIGLVSQFRARSGGRRTETVVGD